MSPLVGLLIGYYRHFLLGRRTERREIGAVWDMNERRAFPPAEAIVLDQLLSDAIDLTFGSLGESTKQAVLYQLKSRYALSLGSPGLTIDRFSRAVIDIFGIEGGRLLMEKIWLTLEELAAKDSKVYCLVASRGKNSPSQLFDDEKAFNDYVSGIFREFVNDALGPDVFTWLEFRLQQEGTTFKKFYFDADTISAVLWTNFSTAAEFLENNLISLISGKFGISNVPTKTNLRKRLDFIRTHVIISESPDLVRKSDY
jgi:hypothetical protein